MVQVFSDTAPQVEDLQIQLMRDLPAWRKLRMLSELNASGRLMAMAGLRRRHPQAQESELRRRLADLLLGADLARQAFGDLDENA
jgi:hypothetical protein